MLWVKSAKCANGFLTDQQVATAQQGEFLSNHSFCKLWHTSNSLVRQVFFKVVLVLQFEQCAAVKRYFRHQKTYSVVSFSSLQAQVFYWSPERWSVLRWIIALSRTVLFWTETSDVFLKFCYSHFSSLRVTGPSGQRCPLLVPSPSRPSLWAHGISQEFSSI